MNFYFHFFWEISTLIPIVTISGNFHTNGRRVTFSSQPHQQLLSFESVAVAILTSEMESMCSFDLHFTNSKMLHNFIIFLNIRLFICTLLRSDYSFQLPIDLIRTCIVGWHNFFFDFLVYFRHSSSFWENYNIVTLYHSKPQWNIILLCLLSVVLKTLYMLQPLYVSMTGNIW